MELAYVLLSIIGLLYFFGFLNCIPFLLVNNHKICHYWRTKLRSPFPLFSLRHLLSTHRRCYGNCYQQKFQFPRSYLVALQHSAVILFSPVYTHFRTVNLLYSSWNSNVAVTSCICISIHISSFFLFCLVDF